jgi:hypothetical protein
MKGKEHLECCFHQAIYGLKQASQSWYSKIDKFLQNQSMTRKSQPIYIHWSWSLHNNNPLCGWLTIYMKPCKEGIFTIRKPLFDHRTQGLYYCHLSNIISKWNKFKWEILEVQIMIIFMVMMIFHMHM